jgi:predicted amidohydrolase
VKILKVAVVQLGINDLESKQERIARVEGIIDDLTGMDLIILPELWNIGFFSFDRYHAESETLGGETICRLAVKAAQLNSYIFTGSIVECSNNKYYNTCVMLNRQGKVIDFYRKMHLFGFGSAERKLLSPGEETVVVDTDFGKIGLSICYDLRFPELFRRLVDQGAEVIINCAAWPYPRVEHWNILNQARAIENQCYFISCGCAGSSNGKAFIGRSMIIDPWGTIVSCASERETIIKTEIYPENVKAIREEFSALKDRMIK